MSPPEAKRTGLRGLWVAREEAVDRQTLVGGTSERSERTSTPVRGFLRERSPRTQIGLEGGERAHRVARTKQNVTERHKGRMRLGASRVRSDELPVEPNGFDRISSATG